jgi:hypothetical protein
VAAAVYRDPSADMGQFQLITPMLERLFKPDVFAVRDGKRVGWVDADFQPRAEPALWALMALAAALGRDDALTEAERTRFQEHLAVVQEIAETFYPLHDGGWNILAEGGPALHYVYPTWLALHALLDLRSGGLCWRGSCETLDKMIGDTARWLIAIFVDEPGMTGWRRFDKDGLPPAPDLDILIYGVLARAHEEIGVALPERIEIAALRKLTDLRHRPYYPAFQEIDHDVRFTDAQGRSQQIISVTRIIWYPWSAETLQTWLRYAVENNYAPDVRRGVERAFGHVVVTLADTMVSDMSKVPPWIQGETEYGLGRLAR